MIKDKCGFCRVNILKDSFEYKRYKNHFCSLSCHGKYYTKAKKVFCKNCGKEFIKLFSEIKKHPNNFCCRSCAATYNNTHKVSGYRRSKVELYIEKELTKKYSKLGILFNNKEAINSELDIYIPSLKLAFEINGIYHYEPIHGEDKLSRIQKNDENKFLKCQEKGISLCILDVSSIKYFKEEKVKKFLDIITKIIDDEILKMAGRVGFEPT